MDGLDLLVELRRHGLKQQDLADRLSVSKVTISKYVRGHKRITPERAELFRRVIRETAESRTAQAGAR